METVGSHTRRQRPMTTGSRQRAHSSDYHDHDIEDDLAVQQERPQPVRPSTQRNTRSTPRAVDAMRRLSGNGDEAEKMRAELETVRTKLREADFAKSQAQVQLQRQSNDMAKLERYVGQLVEDRGGVDDSVMENIVRDIERSSRVKSAHKKMMELASDLRDKEKQIAVLRRSQDVNYTLKLAEEKEKLAARVERLVVEANDKHQGATTTNKSRQTRALSTESCTAATAGYTKISLAELERLRAQNVEMRKEKARLRAKLDLIEMSSKGERGGGEGGSGDGGGGGGGQGGGQDDGQYQRLPMDSSGAKFHEGQVVECRKQGSDSWYPATIDFARQTVEPLGRTSGGSAKTYLYSVYFDDREGTCEDNVPEYRLRATGGGDHGGDGGSGGGSSWVVKNRDGETLVRSRVFAPGEAVAVRDSGAGGRSAGKRGGGNAEWTPGEVIRRNDGGTYRVVVKGGDPEGGDFHPTMLRAARDGNTTPPASEVSDGGGRRSQTKTKATSPAEEAEMQYAEQRDRLLTRARAVLPAPLQAGQEVLAKNGGSAVWSPGIVVSVEDDGLHCAVEFDFGDVEESIPCIFVRPRRGVESMSAGHARPGDSVLAQKGGKEDPVGDGDGRDWYSARFERYHNDDADLCFVVFAGEQAVSRVRASRVRPLYLSGPATGRKHSSDDDDNDHVDDVIPENPPPPTKPVRAKKHQEGDIVLACIPKVKKWTPALITGVKGRGRYSVEWADGTKAGSLLFMFIASMDSPIRKGAFSVANARPITTPDPNDATGGGGSDDRRGSVRLSNAGNHAAATAAAVVRIRQRALAVGEPVLAKRTPGHSFWSPGSVTRAPGGGKYDIRFTDGTTAEDLSFLFVRGLGSKEGDPAGENGELEVAIGNDSSASDSNHSPGARVGDTVYVLKRGNSPDMPPQDLRNKDLWRVGKVTAFANGRFTVQYDGEEGKPKESRIVAERLRVRKVVRQKAVQKGDAVMALSKIPGRGWLMGAVTARGSNGKYTIAFADGTESDEIRFVHLRRVIDSAAVEDDGKDHDHDHDKPARRAIRQRRFKKGEIALAKHPKFRKWVVAKVLEALPSGRYDLEFLGDTGAQFADGVAFQHMRHLDLARFSSGSVDEDRSRQSTAVEDAMRKKMNMRRENRGMSDESWDEHEDEEPGASRAERQRRQRQHEPSDGVDGGASHKRREDRGGALSDTKDLDISVGSDVFVLRRGKSAEADLEDKTCWRPGTIVSVRSNGTVAVQYDEAGAPKEDRIAENRLRRRRRADHPSETNPRGKVNNTSGNHGRNTGSNSSSSSNNNNNTNNNDINRHSYDDHDDGFHIDAHDGSNSKSSSNDDRGGGGRGKEALERGDTVFAPVDGRGQEQAEATVEAYLGDDLYRVSFADGSGTKDVESHKLSTPRHAGLIETGKRAVKMRKLVPGEVVIARRPGPNGDPSEQKRKAGKVIKSVGQGNYSVLFSGETDATVIHFTKLKTLDKRGDDGGDTAKTAGGTSASAEDNSNTIRQGASGFLRVTAPTFDLTMAASVARRTNPRLILATGERGDADFKNGPWLHRTAGGGGEGEEDENDGYNSSDAVGFVVRGPTRPGSRNPAWKDGEFWLSLDGLEDPALFLALEDGKKAQQQQLRKQRGAKDSGARGGALVSEDAIFAEACIPLPLEAMRGRSSGGGSGGRRGSRSSGTFEVKLGDGAGVVSLQWSAHEDTSSMRTQQR